MSLLAPLSYWNHRRPVFGTVRRGLAVLLMGAVIGCSKKEKEAPEVVATPPVPVEEPFGAETIEEFKQRFYEACLKKDHQKYLKLHCLEKLPPTMRASITGAVRIGSIEIVSFQPTKVEIEAITEKELEQIQPGDWSIQPTHWVIVNGANSRQFKHWELGQFEGRYYFSHRIR